MNIETPVSDGHRYGCWGTKRGGTKTASAPAGLHRLRMLGAALSVGWVHYFYPVTTPWLPIACGHDMKHRDPSCSGCPNLESKNG